MSEIEWISLNEARQILEKQGSTDACKSLLELIKFRQIEVRVKKLTDGIDTFENIDLPIAFFSETRDHEIDCGANMIQAGRPNDGPEVTYYARAFGVQVSRSDLNNQIHPVCKPEGSINKKTPLSEAKVKQWLEEKSNMAEKRPLDTLWSKIKADYPDQSVSRQGFRDLRKKLFPNIKPGPK